MSDNLVIVALPSKRDEINKVSSEKAAHVTLLFLGENSDVTPDVVEFVEHAVNTSFERIYVETPNRGPLGPDQADVLFIEGRGARKLAEFRSLLLNDPNIRRLYDANDQYPQFTPHLTLGYPDKPAKEPEHAWVLEGFELDRIAVWTADSDGIEFKPEQPPYDEESDHDEVKWSSIDHGPVDIEADLIAHYGVKGMKWGVRKSKNGQGQTVVSIGKDRKPQKVQTNVVKVGPRSTIVTTKGGHAKVHPDAVRAKAAAQKRRRSGTDTLSNKELKALADRLTLETRIDEMNKKSNEKRKKRGRKWIDNMPDNHFDDAATNATVGTIKRRLRSLMED